MSENEVDPREYCKIKYSTPPGSCKCGNCQLVPLERLIEWSDAMELADNHLDEAADIIDLLTVVVESQLRREGMDLTATPTSALGRARTFLSRHSPAPPSRVQAVNGDYDQSAVPDQPSVS